MTTPAKKTPSVEDLGIALDELWHDNPEHKAVLRSGIAELSTARERIAELERESLFFSGLMTFAADKWKERAESAEAKVAALEADRAAQIRYADSWSEARKLSKKLEVLERERDERKARVKELEQGIGERSRDYLDATARAERAEARVTALDALNFSLTERGVEMVKRVTALERERDEARRERDNSNHQRKRYAELHEQAEADVTVFRGALKSAGGALDMSAAYVRGALGTESEEFKTIDAASSEVRAALSRTTGGRK